MNKSIIITAIVVAVVAIVVFVETMHKFSSCVVTSHDVYLEIARNHKSLNAKSKLQINFPSLADMVDSNHEKIP